MLIRNNVLHYKIETYVINFHQIWIPVELINYEIMSDDCWGQWKNPYTNQKSYKIFK